MTPRVKLALLLALSACGDDSGSTAPITFGQMGSLVGDAGKGSWRFGVATAATQIEDMNTHTDWYVWSAPTSMGGLGKGSAFVGNATDGYTMAIADVQLLKDLGVDSYRFSIEWARIEPAKDQIDEAAIQHYRDVLMALRTAGIKPLVTLHHFSNPIWVDDPRATGCSGGPTDTNLCGLSNPDGAPLIIQEMADHAKLLAQRFGDLVDEWGTVNEPINYLLTAYGIGFFPPGITTITNVPAFVAVVRNYLAAHAAMYHAIKDNDTVDADGDGVDAVVGLSMSIADFEPARHNLPSTDPADLAARDRLTYLFHYIFVDSARTGMFDFDLDGTPDEMHPEWANTVDWLGVQYYFRAGVSADRPLIGPPVNIAPCIGGNDNGSCLPAADISYCVPRMNYEGWTDGIHDILVAFGKRYPDLPLVVTEAGIATDVGARRAENIVRVLEATTRARDEGVDIRGYYHWSLTDNFEWAEGFKPHFGLYKVDYNTFARSSDEGTDAYTAIVHARSVTADQRKQYGGTGPMTMDPEAALDTPSAPFCPKPE